MKPKIFLLAIGLLSFALAKANDNDPSPANGKTKKDDLLGLVLQSDSKRPLKDVYVTAYLLTKKEKVVLTDEGGNYSFDELKPGTYKFVFEKSGFKRVTKDKVVVKQDEGCQLNVEMIENSDVDLMPSPFHFSDI